MAAADPYVGNIGTVLRLVVRDPDGAAVDISSASTKQIKILKPSGTVLTKTASFTTTGTDGKLQYTTIAGDLSEAGRWEYQAYLAGVSGFTGHTSKVEFMVYQPLGL